jgi:hypothetical protein
MPTRSRAPARPHITTSLRHHWLKTGESVCVIVGVVLLVFQSFLQWQQVEGFREQLQLQRADVMALRESLARDAYSRSADTALRVGDVLLEHPEIRSALHPSDPLNCLPATLQKGYHYLLLNLELISSLWGYYQLGAMDDADWASWERWFQGEVIGSSIFPALWSRERDYYTPQYREYVDRQLATVAAAREASAAPTPPADVGALTTATAWYDPTATPPAACTYQTLTEDDILP